jgi:hypothetical protein
LYGYLDEGSLARLVQRHRQGGSTLAESGLHENHQIRSIEHFNKFQELDFVKKNQIKAQ